MQIDRKTLDSLLAMSDKQLMALVGRLAAGSGVDLGQFQIDLSSVKSVRDALSGLSDEDISRIVQQYKSGADKGRR